MTVIFDTLDSVNEAKESGFTQQQAEFQARQLSKIVNNELVTKNTLTTELGSLELKIVKWMVGISIAQIGIILSIINFMVTKHT